MPHSGAPEYDDAPIVDATHDDEMAEEPHTGETRELPPVGSKLVQPRCEPSVSSRPSDRDSGVSKDFKDAMSMYDEGRYAEAETAFAAIKSAAHPNHDYADNALYWQGEAAYDRAHYADALAAFTKVVEKYGGGGKAPDALLKIGLCYADSAMPPTPAMSSPHLVAAYPRADASKIAKRKLDDLEN